MAGEPEIVIISPVYWYAVMFSFCSTHKYKNTLDVFDVSASEPG